MLLADSIRVAVALGAGAFLGLAINSKNPGQKVERLLVACGLLAALLLLLN